MEKIMINSFRIGAAILLCLGLNVAHAYGGNQSSGHCDKPVYYDFQPAVNKYLQSFSEFSFVVSGNTVPNSIEVNISFGENKFHFGHKDLQITPLKNGRLAVSGKMDRPVGHGFARLSVTAHSKPGCELTDGYLVRIY